MFEEQGTSLLLFDDQGTSERIRLVGAAEAGAAEARGRAEVADCDLDCPRD